MIDQVPAPLAVTVPSKEIGDTEVSYTRTIAPASAVPEIVGVAVPTVTGEVPVMIGAFGAVVSTTIALAGAVKVPTSAFPAASVSVAPFAARSPTPMPPAESVSPLTTV